MRARLLFIMMGFLIAVGAGASFVHWQVGNARTNVQLGAILSAMSEATADVIYHALRLDHSGPEADFQGAAAASEEKRADLHAAIGRLDAAYKAFRYIAEGKLPMTDSRRMAGGEDAATLAISGEWRTVAEEMKGISIPESLMRIWQGGSGSLALRRDVLEVITLANRLDLYSDYSAPTARNVFNKLQELANARVRPNLGTTLDVLRDEMVASYASLQRILLIVAISIFAVGVAIAFLVFVPMMRNIARAHEDLQVAHDSLAREKIRAESADRAKSEFLANMSHEIRTPMNGVLGMAELLGKTELDNRQKTFADVILKSGNALLTIINDILDFSKIDAGQLTLDTAPFSLAEAIEDVATLVSARVAEKDLELIVRVDPALPGSLVGDVGRIRQIVTNLIGNGVKFTEKGHVLVDVGCAGIDNAIARITVRVEDTGIGIPEHMLQQVFEKFSQVDTTSTRRHEGTGLGLAIASRLVELMGGQMGAESTVGRGSTFWFTIPLPVHSDITPARPVPVDVTGARILVIDDNKVNRDILLEQLRSWNFDCAAAESGEIGLAFLERAGQLGSRVDAIILDYQMPGMNGLEVARRIASTRAMCGIPVLLLTSVDQAVTGNLALQSGISAQLNKPARSSALLETLVSIMQKARTSRRSERPDDATTAPTPPSVSGLATASVPPKRLKTERPIEILVAEDNEVNQLVFSQILDGLGIGYRIAPNGRAAVEMHQALRPRLILMDVSMPEMNGLEATAAIRQAEAGTGVHTPIIGITAHALKGDRESCLEAGMDDYLSKPISPNRLAEKIDAWSDEKVALIA